MRKNNSKLGIGRICLIFFIQLCCMSTFENAFSRRKWDKKDMEVTFNHTDRHITFFFLFYDYWFENKKYGCLDSCDFFYSEGGNKFLYLMRVNTEPQVESICSWLKMSSKIAGERIQLLNSYTPAMGSMLPDNCNELKVKVKVKNTRTLVGLNWVETKKSFMNVRWYLPPSCKNIPTIKILGSWLICNELKEDIIDEIYMPVIVKSNLIRLINDSSVLKSAISTQVKVRGDTDAVTVKGVMPGENIKVYTITGAEVKSVVATDDIVKIKLPKNQIYYVEAGQAHYKIAL